MADQKPEQQQNVRRTFKCDNCQTIHTSQCEYNSHVLGKKHKRQVAMKEHDIKNEAKKQICDTNGVFIGNLPPNTVPDEILAYVGSYGKIDKWIFGSRFAKALFADEQAATIFKKRKHVFKGHVLRTGVWDFHVPAIGGLAKPEDSDPALYNAVVEALGPGSDPDSEIATLQCVLLPPDQSATCLQLCSDLAAALRPVCTDFSVHPFGSVVTGLAFVGSDVDVVVDNTFTLQEYGREGTASRQSYRIGREDMQAVAKALKKHFNQVVPIFGARIPIIKCIHHATQLHCDLSFTNITAVQNSQLISWYIAVDPRVKPFLVVLKYWAKFFELTKACFTNYALVMMGLFYLMQLDDPIVPPVIHLQTNFTGRLYVDGWNITFNPNHCFVESKNTSSIVDLLLGFFEFYAHFDYGMSVICPFIGKTMPKVFFRHVKQLPPELTLCQLNPQEARERLAALKIDCSICVQDPFVLDCNITKSIPQAAVLRIQAMCLSSIHVLKEDCTTGQLTRLLQKRTEDLASVRCLWNNKLSDGKIEITIVVGSYVPIVGPEATLIDAQNVWYDKVIAVIISIFKNIFKFKIEEEELSSVNTQKTEITDGEHSRTIICKSLGPDLCTNRKQIGKQLVSCTTDTTISFLAMQERITQHIMTVLSRPVETVDFKCYFRMLKDPTCIVVQLSDIASSVNVFNLYSTLFGAHLANWTKIIMDAEK